MKKRRKHKHTNSSFSTGFLLCTDHNTFAATFVSDHISNLKLPTVIHMIYSFELKVVDGILDKLRTQLNR